VEQNYPAIVALSQASESLSNEVRGEIYYHIGDYHRGNGQIDLALNYLRKSQELAHGRWETFLALGLAYFCQENYRDAQGCFQEAQRLSPSELAPAYEFIAEIVTRNRRDGQSESFLPFFERSIDLYEKTGNLSAANRCRLRLSDCRGRLEPEEFLRQAGQLSLTGQQDKAEQMIELALRQHPKVAFLAFQLGEAYRANGKERRACRCYLRALQHDSAELHARAGEAAADIYTRLKIYPQVVQKLYRNAAAAYSSLAQEQAANRCHHKLSFFQR
jgi:tetratricopeptide (TPR) repeat protein